jgi:centromere-localized protein 2
VRFLTAPQLYGAASGAPVSKHDINSIIPELASSAEELDASIQALEKEEAELLQSIKQTVGSMSDLRYGRLSNGQLTEQVLEGLQNVQETCQARH